MKSALKIDSRFTEPSTWAGLATGIISIAQVLPPNLAAYLYGLAGIFSMFSVGLREKGNLPSPPAQPPAVG
jgi:hypothetical protein